MIEIKYCPKDHKEMRRIEPAVTCSISETYICPECKMIGVTVENYDDTSMNVMIWYPKIIRDGTDA